MLEQVQGIPQVLIHLARQVSPHDLVMGGTDPGSPLSSDSTFPMGPLRMTLSWVGSPVLAPGIEGNVN